MNGLSMFSGLASLSGVIRRPRLKWGVVLLQTGDMAALDKFEALFKGAKFYKGLEMSFTNTKDGSLALRIGDEEVGRLHRPCCTMRGL